MGQLTIFLMLCRFKKIKLNVNFEEKYVLTEFKVKEYYYGYKYYIYSWKWPTMGFKVGDFKIFLFFSITQSS